MRRVLIACEESQAVTIEMRSLGIEAYSCDLLPCSGGYPEWHIQGDVFPVLDQGWDMIIAFPPCTHLASSGARYFAEKRADGRQQSAIDFFMVFANHSCSLIAIENPIGIMSSCQYDEDSDEYNQAIEEYNEIDWDSSGDYLIGDWIKDKDGLYTPDESGEYAAIVREDVTQVVLSKYTTRARLCSPCYPGQADVDPNRENGGFLAYTLPKEAFDY